MKKFEIWLVKFIALFLIAGLFRLVFYLIGHAPSSNPFENTDSTSATDPIGFGWGVWHGTIALFTAWTPNGSTMYEVHNNGLQYNLGFLSGFIIVFSIGRAIMRYTPEEKSN